MRKIDDHLGRHVGPAADALVFTGDEGAPLRRSGFQKCYWKPAVAAAGLDGLKVHKLRHSFVSLWVAAEANVKEVSVRAGHSSVSFTLDRYGHLYEDRSDDLADRLDDLLTPKRAARLMHD
jgi:integrase